MRFASLGGSNAANYAAAGKAVADSAANMHAVQRKTGPDYAGLSKVAMASQTAQNIGAMQAEAAVTEDAINAIKSATLGKIKGQNTIELGKYKNKERMAGILPAVGKIVGSAFKKDPKRPPPLLQVDPVQPEKVDYPEYEGERPQAPTKPSFIPIGQGTPESSNTNSSAESTVQSADVPVSSSLKLTSKDYDELAFAVTSEAQQGTMDEYAVAASIINRLNDPKKQYGSSVYEIIRRPGQYEGVEIGNSIYDPAMSARFQSPEGQKQLQTALARLNGRTHFKGQTMLHNRVPNEDPMFSDRGNFFHYSWQ
jgi:hypothetical protein